MDDVRFDVWTRRRFGLVAGSAIAPLLGLIGIADIRAKKKKKRCKKLGQPCQPGGRACCRGRTCGGPPESRFCCKQGGEPCEKPRDCCNETCFQNACANN